jgi:LCP family protein required for cell wall assembly
VAEGSGKRRKVFPFVTGINLAVVSVIASAAGVVIAVRGESNGVARVPQIETVLSPPSTGFVNYLIVGSDTREGADPNSPDYGGIGDVNETSGRRSDTIILMHVDEVLSTIALTSIPRDLWIEIPGQETNRINTAYGYGEAVLIDTVKTSLGVPVHHYVEVDFNSFKAIIAAIDGVELCFEYPTRDINTGLNVPVPGCVVLDSIQSLAYARSRYFEQFKDGEWQVDGRADLGRIERQQLFFETAISRSVSQVLSNPFRSGELISAAVESLRVDGGTDLIEMANAIRPVASGGIVRVPLPVYADTVRDKSILRLAEGSPAILEYLSGGGDRSLFAN